MTKRFATMRRFAVKQPIRSLVFLGLLTTITLLSCQKEKQPDSPPRDITLRKTDKNLLTQFPRQNQRLIYNLLAATEKSDLWAYHLMDGLVQINATKPQQQFIVALFSKLTADFFGQSALNTERAIARIHQEAQTLFSRDKLIYLFYTLDKDYSAFLSLYNRVDDTFDENDPAGGNGTQASSSCSCAIRSDFCSGVFTCTASDCSTSNSGCGFLFTYSCNGVCTR